MHRCNPLKGISFLVVIIFFLLTFCSVYTVPSLAQDRVRVSVYGPETFTRTTGKPKQEIRTFTFPRADNDFTMRVTNGDPKITSAIIQLNGETIFTPNDFKKKVPTLERTVSLVPENTLMVELRSKPDAFITIEIFGEFLPPPPPLIDPVTSPTNIATQTITGTAVPGGVVSIGGGVAEASGPSDPVTGTFNIEVALNEGTNDLIAWVTDILGLRSDDTSFAIIVDTTPPQIAITAPANGSELTEEVITVTGTIDDNTATVTVNGIDAVVSNNTFTATGVQLTEGENTITATGVDPLGNSASDNVAVTLCTKKEIDLTPYRIDVSRISTDAQSLKTSGMVDITIVNNGPDTVSDPFHLFIFEDRNNNRGFDEASDNVLGRTTITQGISASSTLDVSVDIIGDLLFTGNFLYAYVDATDQISELDETNNIGSSQSKGVDLTGSCIGIDRGNCPDSVAISARVGNTGGIEVGPGVKIAFYEADIIEVGTNSNLRWIGTGRTATSLAPGEYEEVTIAWDDPASGTKTIYAWADDTGGGSGVYEETNEDNNMVFANLEICSTVSAIGVDSIAGQVIDAVTGLPIAGATVGLTVLVQGFSETIAQVESNADGYYLFENLDVGEYNIKAQSFGYVPGSRKVILSAGQSLTKQHIVLSPMLASGEIRIVLTWGKTPDDLEAHLTGPNPEGCRYHCFFWEKSFPGVQLDKDDRDGYGPETITITQLIPGTYRYYVHDWTNRHTNTSAGLCESEAEVRVYRSNAGDPIVFTVPFEPGTVWHVFDLDARTGRIIPVNKMTSQDHPGEIDYPVIITEPVTTASIGVPYTYELKAVDPDNDPLYYSLECCPDGMTIDQNTGVITWTPTKEQKTQSNEAHKVRVSVSDGRCGSDVQDYEITVSSIMIAASPRVIYPGQLCTLSWTCDASYTCFIDQGIGPVNPSGSREVLPADDTTYTIIGIGPAETLTASTTIIVEPSVEIFTPAICEWYPGDPVTITWSAKGADSCFIDQGIGEVGPEGTITVYPDQAQPIKYTLTAYSTAGVQAASTYVPNYQPVEIRLTASPAHILPGETTTIFWETTCSDKIDKFEVSIGDLKIDEIGEPGGGGSYWVTRTYIPNSEYTFKAYCSGEVCREAKVQIFTTPVVSLTASPHTFYPGQSCILTWTSVNADTCSIEPGIGEVPLNGSIEVSPTETTTYTLTATSAGGASTASATVFQAKPAIQISAEPSILKTKTPTALTWTTHYADSCTIDQGIGEVPLNGSIEVNPIQTTKYTLTATGSGGASTASATVFYVEPSVSITADPHIIAHGETTTLSWTSALADYCVINNDIGQVEANGSIGVSPAAPTTYTITAYGPGGTAADTITISFLEVSLQAFPQYVSIGQKSTLSWTSVNADACVIEPGIGAVSANGSIEVFSIETTTYTITAYHPDCTASDSATVTVRIADDIDIRPIKMEIDTSTDIQALTISGHVYVRMEKSGQEGVLEPFQVIIFEDRNCNGAYDPVIDTVFGSETISVTSWFGNQCGYNIPIYGITLFRDNRIYACVDAHDVLNEFDEANNIIHSGMLGADTVDLSSSFIRIDNTQCPAAVVLTVRIGNGGNLSVPARVKVSFYDGSPVAGGYLIGTVATTEDLAPGQFQDISFTWNAPIPGLHAIYAQADDEGTGASAYTEMDKVNNIVKGYLSVCDPGVGGDPGWISGEVLDAQTGTPLKDAVVFLREIESGGASTVIDMATSGPDGSYLFDSVSPGSYLAEASLIGYRIATRPITLCSGEPLTGQNLALLPHLSIIIISPADESYVGVSPITVTGTLNYDADSVVVNGIQGVVSGNTFTAEGVELAEGNNTITATAWDADGNMAEKSIYLTHDPMPLTVQITEPLDGSTASGSYIMVRFFASDPLAQVTVNGIPSTWSGRVYGVPIAEGANTITATAKDQCGRTATHSITVHGEANLPPSLIIVEPVEYGTTHSSPITVSGTIADDSATVVINGVTAVVSNKTFTAEVSLVEGENILTATATDTDGNTDSDSIEVFYHMGAPTCEILWPEDGFIEYGSSRYLNVRSSLNTIVVNGEPANTSYGGDGYYYCWAHIELTDGPNVITAIASDSYGNTAQASITGFYAGDNWPWVNITSPRQGTTVSDDRVDVTGTVQGDTVFVTVNGIKATVTNGIFTAEGVELASGYNYITATATGPYNAVETCTRGVYCTDQTPPSITIEYPQDGATVSSSPITVTGTVDDNNATVTVNGVTALVVNNTFTANNIYLVPGPNLITVKASDQKGNTRTTYVDVTCTKLAHIIITSPEHGTAVIAAAIMVEGTYKAQTEGVVITVNDIEAMLLDNGKFIANAVPVAVGENTITATITDGDGNTDVYTITIYINEIIQDVHLTSNIQSGVPPLEITFTVEYSYTTIDDIIVEAGMDIDGDGVTDFNPTSMTFTHIYETPGVYYPTITLIDDSGKGHSGSVAIVVHDRNNMDALLKGKWNGMKEALIAGDIEGALKYFHPGSREKYGKIYNLFGDYLSNVGAALGDIHMVWVHDDRALYYTISNEDGEEYVYDVLLSRDESGIWRIEEY